MNPELHRIVVVHDDRCPTLRSSLVQIELLTRNVPLSIPPTDFLDVAKELPVSLFGSAHRHLEVGSYEYREVEVLAQFWAKENHSVQRENRAIVCGLDIRVDGFVGANVEQSPTIDPRAARTEPSKERLHERRVVERVVIVALGR